MHNVLKWVDIFEKCCKIFEVCLIILKYYTVNGYVHDVTTFFALHRKYANIFGKYAKKTAGNGGFGHTVGGNR